MAKGLVIPVEGPLYEIEVDGEESLKTLQTAVDGWIEAVGLPEFVDPRGVGTAYVNEEGKFNGCKPNMRATDFMVPGVGIMFGDYIAGNMVLLGIDPETGENADVPPGAVNRARLIEREAG
jgi:hypothetical protein